MITENLLPALHQGERFLPSAELLEEAREAAELAKHASAPRTRALYRYEFEAFERWCVQRGAPALPTTPELLATYLGRMHKLGRAASRLGVMRASVLWMHRQGGHEFNSRAECIRSVMSAARRERTDDPRRAKPFLVADFHDLAEHMGETLTDLRDTAMLGIGLARALRGPSELITLDFDRLGTPDGRGYIQLDADGATIKLVKSKTSQEATRVMKIARGPAVEALERWIKAANITPGTPLWRTVTQNKVRAVRLNPVTWSNIVKRRAAQLLQIRNPELSDEAAKRDGDRFSTHSLRRGTITTMARKRLTLSQMREVSGHAEGSASILLGYMAEESAGVDTITELGL